MNDVKRRTRFTVVLANPPYSERSKNSGAWIKGLMERYKTTIRTEEAQIKTVSNEYVKLRNAERSASNHKDRADPIRQEGCRLHGVPLFSVSFFPVGFRVFFGGRAPFS